VSDAWCGDNLRGVPVASLRQTAIQRLVSAVGCDGPQLDAHTGLSLGAVGVLLGASGRPR
jgi:hypothetical protein